MPRLRRSDSSAGGLGRVRSGKGFSYRDPVGIVIKDPHVRDRIVALSIPPAWTEVWIAPYANGHIQATGVDAAGRTQYVYHSAWRKQKDRLKFDRVIALAETLPAARRKVTVGLRENDPTKTRGLAAAFRLLDTGAMRVGSERYLEEHGSRGLSTLLCSQVSISGDVISFAFPGKSLQEWASVVQDAELAGVLRGLKRRGPRARLLAYKDGTHWRSISAEDINQFVREKTEGDYTAKDFRTLQGTVTAAIALARTGPQKTAPARKRAVAQVMREVAEVLGNTPAVARSSYVDPRIVDRFDRGQTIDPSKTASAESQLREMLSE
ncbi:MAG: DNA topoisomerase IB [Salinibacterium sp.]|nr:DNA topoisomerase IB [Salinibacterium sp.]